uniref:carbohydrate-binding protein n=1 Tax=Cellvibrio fontiphilus TaxID=1815559 RepID=UPI002B4C07A0|nr:carbohydrate-binding protein [Cellvibrio fontiphilus]
MLKPLFRVSALGLIMMGANSLAQTPAAPSPAAVAEYTKFKTQNYGEILLETGTQLRFEVTNRENRGEVEIVTARLLDPYAVTDANYRNLIVTLTPNTGDLVAFAETTEGHFDFNPGGDATRLWRKSTPPAKLDDIHHPKAARSTKAAKAVSPTAAPLVLGEKDASGRYVVDVFIGFSTAAANSQYVRNNLEATAQSYIEQVNTALKNSKVENVYLRLVGTGTSPNNPGVVTSVLDDVNIWFAADIERTAPDLVGMVQMPTDAPGSAGGWAGVGGDTHVIGAPWPSAYRHEVGHNVGGVHCPDGSGYHFGHTLGEGRGTIQCGNNLAYYSSPLIKDEQGNVLGDAQNSDMARKWRERAAEMSANRIHKVPFPDAAATGITLQAEDYTGFYDTTSGNTGGAYRQDGVDIQTTTDTGGGHNVGWIANGEWLAYKVNLPAAGRYQVSYRVASLNTQGVIQFEKQGGAPVYGQVTVPVTGGWQQWATVSHEVSLPAGEQFVALALKTGNFNLNWIKLDKLPDSLGTFRLQNVWQTNQYIHIENGIPESTDVPAGYWSSQWVFEPVSGSNTVRLVNRWKPDQVLTISNGNLTVASAAKTDTNSHWELEKVTANEYRLKNRAAPTQYIHNQYGRLQVGSIQPGWWSARWTLVAAQ